MTSSVGISVLIFSILFGPRLGVFDSWLFVVMVVVLMVLSSSVDVKIRNDILPLLVMLVLIIVYVLFVNLFMKTAGLDVYAVGRVIRLLLNIFLLYIILSFIKVDTLSVLRAISLSMMVHVFAIFIQIVSFDVMLIMSNMTGISKINLISPWRVFGLSSSFDFAGLYLCIGMLVQLYLHRFHGDRIYPFFIFFIAGIFTGRIFVIIGGILFVLSVIKLLFRRSTAWLLRLAIIVVSLVVSVGIYEYIYPILKATVYYSLDLPYDGIVQITEIGVHGYYLGSLERWLDFFKIPSDMINLLFGGSDLRNAYSDSGAIKIIHSIGMVGYIIILVFYAYLLIMLKRYAILLSPYLFSNFIVPLFILIFVYDLKVITLLSRGLTEIVIVIFLVVSQARYSYENRLRTKLA